MSTRRGYTEKLFFVGNISLKSQTQLPPSTMRLIRDPDITYTTQHNFKNPDITLRTQT